MPSGPNRPRSSRSSVSSAAQSAQIPAKPALDILRRWGITVDELTRLVDDNRSLRGIMLGYVAEHHLTKFLASSDQISDSLKYDDHDRTKKGDRVVTYKGHRFIIESKSLQTNQVKDLGGGKWSGKAQVDGSDRRKVTFPDGTTLETTLLLPGEFDVLAVNCFAFGGTWQWAFCKNSDLPRSTHKKYTDAQRAGLLASLVNVGWPPTPPFTDDIFKVLDALIAERSGTSASSYSRKRGNKSDSSGRAPVS
ncbi:MAG: hypothetical protein FLDDKLPJ_03599 [Phycisphaerae bacterium]|nr:hypothetical protein [Phycisphaerae bacterium]